MAAIVPINVDSMIHHLGAGEYIGKPKIYNNEYELFHSERGKFVLTGSLDERPVEIYIERSEDAKKDPAWKVIEAYEMEDKEKFEIRRKGPFEAGMPLTITASLAIDSTIKSYFRGK